MSQGANLASMLSAHGSQFYNQWVQRLKQICNDINWEVREQVARDFAKLAGKIGPH